MNSSTTARFRKAFRRLPPAIRQKAREAFRLWQADPWNPSLRFKKVHPTRPIYAVRVGLGWRALAVMGDDEVIWFWIGSHADYDHLVSSM